MLEKLKLDRWYGIVMYLGILTIGSSLLYKIDFLSSKNIFGLGLGAIIIGLSFFIAEKKISTIKPPNAYTGPAALISTTIIDHNLFTILLLFVGVIIIAIFGFKIIISLF